jgi:uncharacterized membrane protein YkvA (DUF1232 family)
MNGVAKGMIIALVILYVISPIDFAPGPVDDLIVVLLGIAATAGKKRLSTAANIVDVPDRK